MTLNKVPQNLRMTTPDKNLAFTLDPTKSFIQAITPAAVGDAYAKLLLEAKCFWDLIMATSSGHGQPEDAFGYLF